MARMRTSNVAEVAQLLPVGLPGPQPQWAGEPPAPRQRSRAAGTPPFAMKRKRSARATSRWQRLSHSVTGEHRPLTLALLLSLLIHTLLLSLIFGGQEHGLPGFGLPWRDRRIEVPDLHIVLLPAPPAKPVVGPKPQASIEQPVARGPAPAPAAPARAKGPDHVAPAPQIVESTAVVDVVPFEAPTPVVPAAPPAPAAAIAVAPSASSPKPVTSASREAVDGTLEAARLEAARVEAARLEAEREETVRRVAAQLEAERLEVARQEAARVEAARLEAERQTAARQAAAQLEAERQEATRQAAIRAEAARLEAERNEAARQAATQLEAQQHEAVRQAAARAEVARLEAERQAAARQAAAQLEAQQQEAARQAAVRAEAARLEAERQAAPRQAAAQLEAQQQEAARRLAAQVAAQLEAQRQQAARQEAARVEAVRLEAERQEAARQAAARQEAVRVAAEQEAAARREATLRAIGRQLDEEADRREAAAKAARPPSTLPLSLSTARRVRLWGRTDPNAELIQYAEAWARKIQFNTLVDTVRDITKRPHTTPMVTVAIRSDGSVESVIFVVSSGVAEVDDAIRRIVQSHAHYPAFPPGLASEYDVIEIRRTWYFDAAVRLY